MSLRSFGTSLATSAAPGSASRDLNESNLGKPDIPGKGGPGSLERQFVEEPLINQPPTGSEKILRSGPEAGVASIENPNPVATPPAEAGGIMSAMGHQNEPTSGGGSAASNTGPFVGGTSSISAPAPASAIAKGGAQAFSQSGAGPAPGAAPAAAYAPKPDIGIAGGSSSAQGPSGQSVGPFDRNPLDALLGARVSAGGGQESLPRNLAQGVAATVAPLVNNFSPSAASGLRSFANNVGITNKGIGSITNPAASIGAVANKVGTAANNLRSGAGQVASNIGSAANNLRSKAGSFLGGLFGRR